MSAADSFCLMHARPKPSLEVWIRRTLTNAVISSAHIAQKKNDASPNTLPEPLTASGMLRPMPPPVRSAAALVSSRSTSATARLAIAK